MLNIMKTKMAHLRTKTQVEIFNRWLVRYAHVRAGRIPRAVHKGDEMHVFTLNIYTFNRLLCI